MLYVLCELSFDLLFPVFPFIFLLSNHLLNKTFIFLLCALFHQLLLFFTFYQRIAWKMKFREYPLFQVINQISFVCFKLFLMIITKVRCITYCTVAWNQYEKQNSLSSAEYVCATVVSVIIQTYIFIYLFLSKNCQ